ncbi:hypothetical protein K402DRAFT_180401 [Aulographum hederae CBS 113979]|uniref:DNA 3'-5' helicase n=1 Tax=Aulographum hederae CBS 113979 TaxID=1176131 RepID=A0A6G1GQI6_9PEZI|nr:hypothetical protein K402DRAFT_180401 [Aulographum hederae CBS 113979]
MGDVKRLRMLHCQFVFLTGTLPPQMEKQFESAVLLQRPYYVRSRTMRTDLEYHVVRYKPTRSCPTGTSLEEFAAYNIKRVLNDDWYGVEGGRLRALVYVRTRSQADKLAVELGCSRYYSDSGTEEEKAEVLTKWIHGDFKILVATSALAGVDYRHVRTVFHVGEPGGGAIDFAQDVGRAGRDGEGGLSVVFLPAAWQAGYSKEDGELLPENSKAMQRFLDQPRCRMIPLSVFLDGQAQSCKNEMTSCDQCQELGLLSSSEARDWMKKGEEEEEQNGNTLLRKYTKQTAEDRERFIWGLELLDGSCVICRLLGDEKQAEHTLDRCRSASKWRFFDAKKAAQKEARRVRKGWLSSFGACFGCGNVQSICGKQAGGGCRFKDLVMPLSWAVLYKADWKEKVLGELDSGKGSVAAGQGELAYMLWLGEAAEIYGEQGSKMAIVADRVMGLILKEVDSRIAI